MVNVTNNMVMDVDKVFTILFILILVKSNKKSNEKNGIRTIPINPRCDNIYMIFSFLAE
jgi:hypothetical protein